MAAFLNHLRTLPLRQLTALWLAWAVLLISFQLLATARFQPARPDRVLFWTATETEADSQNDKPTLIDPFLNQLVSWDSEFYLSIAINGYEDPNVRTVERLDKEYSLNYAFFPLYPLLIRGLSIPLSAFGMTPIATATLAGVIIALLGTLAAMIALYDLARHTLDESDAFRAVFYLLIFPSSMFLAQVYTEALFIGLSFVSLALLKRRVYIPAALIAGFAVWTRAVGVALGLAMLVQLLDDEPEGYKFVLCPFPTQALLRGGLLAFIPAVFYFIWSAVQGEQFRFVETYFFGHSILAIIPSLYSWSVMLPSLWGAETPWSDDLVQTGVYYAIEFAAIIFAVVACFKVRKQYASLFAFSLFAWAIAFFNGSPHSMIRFVLVLPAIYLYLARLGRNPVFDRAWTIGSLLLFALLAMLFSFDFWVA